MIASEQKEQKMFVYEEPENHIEEVVEQQSQMYQEVQREERRSQKVINQFMKRLCELLYQEKNCPEILQYPHYILEGEHEEGKLKQEGLFELITKQDQGILQLKKQINETKGINKQGQSLYLLLHVVELDRSKYIVKEYLRVRLSKIENLAFYIFNKHLDAKLSRGEFQHLKNLIKIKKSNLENLVLNFLPIKNFGLTRELEENQKKDKSKEEIKIPEPNQNKFVFAQITTNSQINLGNKKLQKGDIYLVKYDTVRKLVEKEYVQLL